MGAQQQHKPGAPVVGFNHNLNYKGRTFHVQTEDSGPQHAHIITHIFLGGNIFASAKGSYADVLPTLEPGAIFAAVRKLMEDQHKAMMRSLVQGAHDAEIERRTGNVYAPGVLAGGEKAPGLLIGGDTPASGSAKVEAPKMQAPKVEPPRPAPRPVSAPQPVVARAPTPASRPPPLSRMAPPTRPPPRMEPRAPEKGFGEGLISERSLDEVILSYLAADVEGSKR